MSQINGLGGGKWQSIHPGLFVVMCTALFVGLCCGSAGANSAMSVAGAVATEAAHASGCQTNASASTTLMATVAGHRRTVIVHVPGSYSKSRPVPLVLNLHGSGSTALEEEEFSGMDATADADGFIVAYPQGLIPEGTGFDWNVPGEPLFGGSAVPHHAANDVMFLTKVVGLLEDRYCIDPARVYATGFSGGARTTSQLACDASRIFAAVAPVSGLRRPIPCRATRPVPVLTFHGTADPVDPYNGHGQAYWTYSVPMAAQDWADQDGCSTRAVHSQPEPGVTLTEYRECKEGAVIELYSMTGEGHEWPGGPQLTRRLTAVLGPQSDALDANRVIWSFFEAHPMK